MFAYLGKNKAGTEIEMIVKKFCKEYESHRCTGDL